MNENVAVFLNKAFDCLEDAGALIEKERNTAAVSRCYYAMFHAAQAALLSENIESFTHAGVNVQFQKTFIKTKRFPETLGKSFSKILNQRMKSDYEIGFKASSDEAKRTFEEASLFVTSVHSCILPDIDR